MSPLSTEHTPDPSREAATSYHGVSQGGTGQPTEGLGGLSVPIGVHTAVIREADLRLATVIREADHRFQAEVDRRQHDVGEERDRRYAEVATEREKALKIKETADLAALGLAREIQTYKDEKANELRSQIESERGSYTTKQDLNSMDLRIAATLKPIQEYVTGQMASKEAVSENRDDRITSLQLWIAIAALVVTILLANHVIH